MPSTGKAAYRAELIRRARNLNIEVNGMTDTELVEAVREGELENNRVGAEGLFGPRILDRIDDGTLDEYLEAIEAAIQDRYQAKRPNVRPMSKTRTVPASSE